MEWSDEAFFAARQKFLDGCIAVGAQTASDIAQEVLAALTPHVEAMVREARAEALREASALVDTHLHSAEEHDWCPVCKVAVMLYRRAGQAKP